MIKLDINLTLSIISLCAAVSSILGYFFSIKFRLDAIDKRVDLIETREIPDLKVIMTKHLEAHLLADKEQQKILSDIDKNVALINQRFQFVDVSTLKNKKSTNQPTYGK